MSENFPDKDRAAAYVLGHDDEAKRLSRRSLAYLAVEEGRTLRESGGRRFCGGPVSRDEKIASILELRWPLISEARAVLAGPEPGSETVPPTAEDPRVTAPLVMTDEAVLSLLLHRGGQVDWNVKDGILTVTVRAYTAEADDDPSGPLVRKWRLVPVIDTPDVIR